MTSTSLVHRYTGYQDIVPLWSTNARLYGTGPLLPFAFPDGREIAPEGYKTWRNGNDLKLTYLTNEADKPSLIECDENTFLGLFALPSPRCRTTIKMEGIGQGKTDNGAYPYVIIINCPRQFLSDVPVISQDIEALLKQSLLRRYEHPSKVLAR